VKRPPQTDTGISDQEKKKRDWFRGGGATEDMRTWTKRVGKRVHQDESLVEREGRRPATGGHQSQKTGKGPGATTYGGGEVQALANRQ